MLIINADDWGRNTTATNNSLTCFNKGRITSVTAMMFMEDSIRSADLAIDVGLNVGLHLNFTEKFNGISRLTKLLECQERIASFLLRSKYSSVLYNPLLNSDFEYVYKAQYDTYVRLYNKVPTHIDGHHHMHLCTNMLLAGIMEPNHKVRKCFSFALGEKNWLNRSYRHLVDTWLKRRFICTDYFFSVAPIQKLERLERIVELSRLHNVELMAHPEITDEYEFLMNEDYKGIIENTSVGSYADL